MLNHFASLTLRRTRNRSLVSVIALAMAASITPLPMLASTAHRLVNGDVTGTVTDSANGAPIPNAEVSVMQSARIIYNASTDAFGRYTAHGLAPGVYTVIARTLGFRAVTRQVEVGASVTSLRVDFALASVAVSLSTVTISASVPLTVDTRSGDQKFKQDSYHGSPTNTTSQIIQQSIAGAARAPTGEVHIRGQHAEYTYYIDGVPVPAGISGSLNELFDPSVVSQIDFQTGAWDAEFGNKNAAIVNVTTKIPSGGIHYNLSGYGGSYSINGQSANVSTNAGPWGVFLSGARQESGMRLEPVILDTARDEVVNFHNHGTDYFGFGKVQYMPGRNDVLNLEGNVSTTTFQVPFDTTGGASVDDHQRDNNSFVNLGWRHKFAAASEMASEESSTASATSTGRGATMTPPELFAGLFYRHGSLRYTPGVTDQPQFVFFPDTATPYNLRENRSFDTFGIKADYSAHLQRELEIKFGTTSQYTRGHEDFVTTAADGTAGPASNSDLKGYDLGLYAQTSYAPVEEFEVRAGVRYDAHNAPFASTQSQVSPRIRLNFFPNPQNTIYLYYGRLFLPTNVEDLRAITSVAQQGQATVPTLPERDHFAEVGYIHRFPAGIVSKLSAYHKESTPGIDDNTVPGSAIVTSVNLTKVFITGVEVVEEIRPPGPLSGYLNLALNHAYGRGPITGGFFPTDTPQGFFDLDHDQRLSGVASITYAPSAFYATATGTYGSGLTNGVDPADCDCAYGRGLFDFNRGIKVAPSFVADASIGYSLTFGRNVVRPEIFVTNVFDKKYLLKGAFFSGASVGRPRTIQLRLSIGG